MRRSFGLWCGGIRIKRPADDQVSQTIASSAGGSGSGPDSVAADRFGEVLERAALEPST